MMKMAPQMHHFEFGPYEMNWSIRGPHYGPAESRVNKGLVHMVHMVHRFLQKLFALYMTLFPGDFVQSLHISSTNLISMDHMDHMDQGSNDKGFGWSIRNKSYGPNQNHMDH
jgi:hypothetical protein